MAMDSNESSPMASPFQPSESSLPTDAPITVSSSHQLIENPIGHQVELRSIAEDFPNLMKFTAPPAMLDLCIMDALMPSPRFMQKMTRGEDIITPPSSIQFADEVLMQAGSPSLPVGAKQQPIQVVGNSPASHTPSDTVPNSVLNGPQSTNGVKQGAWSKPLQIAGLSSPLISSVQQGISALSTEWPELSKGVSKVGNKKPSATLLQSAVKQIEVPHVFSQENSSFIATDQEYPWAERMKGKCNLHRVTNPSYMEDGTPLVSIPSHILLEGVENQKEYVVGQFYRCLVPSGGQTHAVVNHLWGRKCRIFTRKLGEFSYLFHIPDEPTRNWVLQRGLWHVDDCLMFVSPWSPSETISLPAISTVPVWLTLKNIPNQLYSFKGIDWIASGIGAPMITSKPWLDPTQMGEAKILVEVKLSKPFPQKVALKDKSGNITLVDVMYSWLPSKCLTCGQLGHKASRCLGLLSVSDHTVPVTTRTSNEAPSTTTTTGTNALDTRLVSVSPMLSNGMETSVPILQTDHLNSESNVLNKDIVNPASNQPILKPTPEVPNVLITEFLTQLAKPAPTKTVPTDTDLPSENALLSVEESTVIQSASVKDGNIAPDLQALHVVPLVIDSNPFSVLETHEDVSVKAGVCVMENEKVVEGDGINSMGTKESLLDLENLQDEEDSGPKSRVGRPLKPTQKIQEQWITVGGRGNRGRRGRGRGLFN